MKGLIICGYPGVGKSSVAGWKNCIDLESSHFSHDDMGYSLDSNVWVPRYCAVAMDLARQGFTVLCSTHSGVINFFENLNLRLPDQVGGIVIFYPRPWMKGKWIERLKSRYQDNPSEKNRRAYEHALRYFDNDLEFLGAASLPCLRPKGMEYDFKRYILLTRKTFCEEKEISDGTA